MIEQHCFRLSILALESVQYVHLSSIHVVVHPAHRDTVWHCVYSCSMSCVALSRSEVYHISFQLSFNCTAPLDS